MGVPSTFSSRTKTARPLALWPVTTVRTFNPCLFPFGLFMLTFLDSCNLVFICSFLSCESFHQECRIPPHQKVAVTHGHGAPASGRTHCRGSVITSHWPIC